MQAGTAIYLDSNAGAPLHRKVKEAVLPLLDFVSNPSSIHSHGRKAKRFLAEAREQIALSLGPSTDPEQLVFTSSGTEANQLAIRSVLELALLNQNHPHWITTAVEHDSVLQMIEWFKSRGGEVSILPVDEQGNLCISLLDSFWKKETVLVSSVWVNNETGVISPLKELARKVNQRGVKFHLDAAQAWGKLPFDVGNLGAHSVTFSAHKIGGYAGVGIVWVARGTKIEAVIRGRQEKGRRGGSENLIGIVAAGAAASAINPEEWSKRVSPLRDRLEKEIQRRIPGSCINGGSSERVANTINLSFEGIEGDSLVMALDLAGFSVSSGSACSSGVLEPSHVLMAMGKTKTQAMAALRVSLADEMPWESLVAFVDALEKIVLRVRNSTSLISEMRAAP
jgi:cysteine desulfurase